MKLKVWESTAIKIYDLVARKTVASLPLSQNSNALFAKEADFLWIIQRKGLLVGPGTMDVFLWNWRTGKRTAMNTIPHKPIQQLSPDGKTFISVELEWSSNGKIEKIIGTHIIGAHIVCEEAQSGKTVWRVRAQGPVRTLYFFPNGRYIVSSEGENKEPRDNYDTTVVAIRDT